MDNENKEERRVRNSEDDETSLIDLLVVLLRYRWLIIITTVLAMIFAVVFSAMSTALPPENRGIPNLYTLKAFVFIDNRNSYGRLAEFFVETNSFLDAVVDEFDLSKRFGIEGHPRAESRMTLKNLISAEFDKDTSVFTISFTDKDLEFAKSVVVFSVNLIENMFLNLSLESETPIFKMIDVAEVGYAETNRKSGPSRGKLCIIITFVAFFLSLFLAFILNAIESVRNDSESMDKLRSSFYVAKNKNE